MGTVGLRDFQASQNENRVYPSRAAFGEPWQAACSDLQIKTMIRILARGLGHAGAPKWQNAHGYGGLQRGLHGGSSGQHWAGIIAMDDGGVVEVGAHGSQHQHHGRNITVKRRPSVPSLSPS